MTPSQRQIRFIDKSGHSTAQRVGLATSQLDDVYARLIELSWLRLVPLLFFTWIALASLFALLYWLLGDSIAGARPGSVEDAFFFSIQTLSTIGYGVLSPRTIAAHVLVTVESFVGLLGVALVAGLAFAKFSRPSARVLVSERAVVRPRDGVPSLLLRMANARQSHIAEAHVRLTLTRDEITAEGDRVRRFHELRLVRDWTPLFALTWTLAHPIDERSPLAGSSPESLAAQNAEILVSVVGLDLAFSQTVHARSSYAAHEIDWNARFRDVLERGPWGVRVNYAFFHETEPLGSH